MRPAAARESRVAAGVAPRLARATRTTFRTETDPVPASWAFQRFSSATTERRASSVDPDEALKKAREAAKWIVEGGLTTERAEALAEAFDALDGWLSKGGFVPVAWEPAYERRR
jgi:hypothetical protein